MACLVAEKERGGRGMRVRRDRKSVVASGVIVVAFTVALTVLKYVVGVI